MQIPSVIRSRFRFAGDLSRAADVVGRFGGEEFVAILPGNLADATVAGERVRVAFQAAAGTVADCRLDGTVSIGAASGGIDVAALIAAADAALYRAKGEVDRAAADHDRATSLDPSYGAR